VRSNTDGSLDTTFGTDGKVTTDFPGTCRGANALAIQPDGKIVAAEGGGPFALARYNADGSLDTTFGTGGKVTTDFSGLIAIAHALAIDSDGKIIAAGTAGGAFALARYEGHASWACPQGLGYWKNNLNAWLVSNLTLGSQNYSQTELLIILNTPIGSGRNADASLILADQLIAAKLNIANVSDPALVSTTITAADGLLSAFNGKLPYNVRPSSGTGHSMVNDANTLSSYNNGALTPDCTP